MKKVTLFILAIGFTFLYSCKSNEDKAKEIVDGFLKQVCDEKIQREDINYSIMTPEYKHLFDSSGYYPVVSWVLTSQSESDTSVIIKSTGSTHNGFGTPVQVHQEFRLKKRNGDWKINNSYKFLVDELNFEVVDNEWEFYWDREKDEILKQLQEKVKLEVLVPGYKDYYDDYAKGKLKIINNSDYDIKGVDILIEHYDKEGKSVNTDNTYVWDIIRKHGYREIDWLTSDCSECVRQEFKINFIKESN